MTLFTEKKLKENSKPTFRFSEKNKLWSSKGKRISFSSSIESINVGTSKTEIKRLIFEKLRPLNNEELPEFNRNLLVVPIPTTIFQEILKEEGQKYKEQLNNYELFRKYKVLTQFRIPFDQKLNIDIELKKQFIGCYVKEICGVVYSVENVKVLTEKLLIDYSLYYYPIWVEFECNAFVPMAGTVGLGIVTMISDDTIQLNWNGILTVFLMKEDNRDLWSQIDNIQKGCGIYFQVTHLSVFGMYLSAKGLAFTDKEIVYNDEFKRCADLIVPPSDDKKEDQIYEYSDSEENEKESDSDSDSDESQIENEENEEIEEIEPEQIVDGDIEKKLTEKLDDSNEIKKKSEDDDSSSTDTVSSTDSETSKSSESNESNSSNSSEDSSKSSNSNTTESSKSTEESEENIRKRKREESDESKIKRRKEE